MINESFYSRIQRDFFWWGVYSAMILFLAWNPAMLLTKSPIFANEGDEALTFANFSDASGPVRIIWDPVPVLTETGILSASWKMENRSDETLLCELRFFSADTVRPVDEVGNGVDEITRQIELPAGETVSGTFRFRAEAGTYNAHYPLHLKAAFDQDGKRQELHAVRVVEFRFPTPPPNFQTTEIRFGGVSLLGKDYVARYACQGGAMTLLGRDYIGQDPVSGTDVHQYPIRRGDERYSFSAHPPYKPVGGSLFLDFPVKLPALPELTLTYACAVRSTEPSEPQSDGVTFRVWASEAPWTDATSGETTSDENLVGNSHPSERELSVSKAVSENSAETDSGRRLLDEIHTDAKTWVDRRVDLSAYAGKLVTLTVEFNTGPNNDSTCDGCFVSGLTVTGRRTDGTIAAPEKAVMSKENRSEENTPSEKSPLSADVAPMTDLVRFPLANGFEAVVTPGERGFLDGTFTFQNPANGRSLTFRGMTLSLGNVALDGEEVLYVEKPACYWDETTKRLRFRAVLLHEDDLYPIEVTAREENGLFLLELPPENPIRIGRLRLGPADQKGRRVFAAHGMVIEDPQAFQILFEGHRLSSSHVGFDFENGVSLLEASKTPPDSLDVDPDAGCWSLTISGKNGIAFLLNETGAFDAAIQYRALSPWRGKPGLGVDRKAGRLVFDDWSGSAATSEKRLRKALAFGVTDSLFVKHAWQRWGYDVRLPDIWGDSEASAVAPMVGTFEDLRRLADLCVSNGVPFALHDNYTDDYPDANGFTYDDILFNEDGSPQRAWINYGAQAQSYRFRPDRIEPYLLRNLAAAQRFLPQTDAYFVDVLTSITPMDFFTRDGEFHPKSETRECWMKAFRTIAKTLSHSNGAGNGDRLEEVERSEKGAGKGTDPLSEGDAGKTRIPAITISEAGNDSLIGAISGADAQWIGLSPNDRAWSMRIPCESWARTPWFAAVNHSNFIRHGVGYEDRYRAMRNRGLHGMMSDDYLTMEILGGVDLMVDFANIFPGSVRKHFLAQHVIRDRKSAEIEKVTFTETDGRPDIGRQTVRWSNGDVVFANRHAGDWRVKEGVILPHYGCYVEGEDGRLRCSVMRNPENPDEVIELAADGETFYLNGRGVATEEVYAVTPTLAESETFDDGRFRIRIDWKVDEPIPENLRTFIHVYEPYLGYGHQPRGWVVGGSDPAIPTSEWGRKNPDAATSPGDTTLISTDAETIFTLPPETPDGHFQIMVGLYDPVTGKRLPLMGDTAGENRYAVAEMMIGHRDGKRTMEIRPLLPDEDHDLFFRLRGNRTPAAFRGVATLGAVSVTPSEAAWSILPIPVMNRFNVTLREKEIGKKVKTVTVGGRNVDFTREGDDVTFRAEAGEPIPYRVVWE